MATLAACAAAVLGGCSAAPDRSVSLDRFSEGVDTSAGASAPRPVYAAGVPSRPEPETIVIGPVDASASPGPPVENAALPSGVGIVQDAKIGDINGRPIIASRFLEDLMPRLRAIAQEEAAGGREVWRREAREVVARKLDGLIRDEVLYREGRARLPEVNQQGLLFFVERVRENVVRQSRGSAALAEQELLESEGVTLEQFLASIERQAVIKEVLDIAAEDYAPVSWLDIQNEYQKRYKTFNPDPVVFFRLISPASDEAVEAVRARLESKESFESVASDAAVNAFAPDRGGLFSAEGTAISVPLAEARLISDPALNRELVALKPGAWAGPVERASGRAGFVMLERVVEESMPLESEEVQLNIERYLKQVRSEQALSAFVERLKERANLGPERFEELVSRILVVAEARVFGARG